VVAPQTKKLAKLIRNGDNVLFDGKIGSGKTFIVKETAEYLKNEYDFVFVTKHIDLLAPNFEEELVRAAKTSREHTVFVLDPLDEIPKHVWSAIEKALPYSQFIMVSYETWKAPSKVKKNSQSMALRPRSTTIAKRLNVSSKEVTSDQRASVLALATNTKPEGQVNIFDKVRSIFDGKLVNLDSSELAWVYDNVHRFYRGRDMMLVLKSLELYDRGTKYALTKMPSHLVEWGGVKYPTFFRARSAAWRRENETE